MDEKLMPLSMDERAVAQALFRECYGTYDDGTEIPFGAEGYRALLDHFVYDARTACRALRKRHPTIRERKSKARR
jgi:hypothetical protein